MTRRGAVCLLTLSWAIAGCGTDDDKRAAPVDQSPATSQVRIDPEHQPQVAAPEKQDRLRHAQPESNLPPAESIVPDLDALLSEPSIDDIPALIAGLRDKAKRRKLEVAILSFDGRAVQPLVDAVLDESGDNAARLRAAELLGRIGPAARGAAAELLPALKSANEPVRFATAIALAHVDPLLDGTVTVLAAGLGNPDADVRLAALNALTALGENAKPATPSVISRLADENEEVRRVASFALHSAGVEADQLPSLLELLDNEQARPHVVETLTGMRRKAAGAVPRLVELLHDGDKDQRQRVGYALAAIGKSALPELMGLAKEAGAEIAARAAAVRTIGMMGRHAGDAAPFLKAMLEEADDTLGEEPAELRRTIREAIKQIDAPNKENRQP